ncbi:Uu.00g055980.m01.CDS01 [Anthostomella pinea]|uniref:Uu.00g055980.m01.CDS01 n=1 Tax=Anthostomella pinea TaxID=933095 RepID=A0AAI8VY58_9PEZI|nr:Uu.00g055980.m01.CDS01 [Anthostomella pinea]
MDDFSDDDLDALNANALQELENNAIQFTQAQKKSDPSQQVEYDFDFEDDDLDDTIVQDELRGPKSALPPERPAAQVATTAPSRVVPQQQETWGPVPLPASHFRPPPIAANPTRQPAAQPAGHRASQQIASRNKAPPYSQIRPPPPLPRPAASIPSRYQPSQAPRQSSPSAHELAALQAQVLDLKSRLTTKDGEISIVRKRLDKSRDDHERELQVVRKQTAEQLAKHERAVEAAKAAQQSATTELEFTKRDLREEVDRAKRKDGGGTPKKNNAATRSWGVSDGFEDVEMAGSPSRGHRGRNAGPVASLVAEPPSRLTRTPTKGKRKRPTVDSPVMALETHSEDMVMLDDAGTDAIVTDQLSSMAPRPARFDYLKVIMNHSAAHDDVQGRRLTFEYLADFVLPSRPTESLAAILFGKLATAGNPDDPMRLPIEFCELVIQLWDDCRKEGCLAPIAELVSLVTFTLQLYTVAIAPYIAPSLLPVAMDSCYEVAIPRFYCPHPGDPTDEAFKNFRDNIATSKILSLLYLTALGCATSEPVGGGLTSPILEFWSQVHPEFVMTLVSQKQTVEDFLTMLRLLCTSVFPDTIGPINPDRPRPPAEVSTSMIDRMSGLLGNTPRWDLDESQLRKVRMAVLQTLAAFARSPFGLTLLARNDSAIPCLVMLLSGSIDELYDGDMHYVPPGGRDADSELQQLVAQTMLLLHTIITSPISAGIAEVATKLAKTTVKATGGVSQKYELSLARLNFAEDLVSEETAELAHELLELAVTSEAGEELGAYFGG